jgi:hypothetical protein
MLVNRFEAVEIIIPSGSTATRFYFPNLPNLTNALVDRIVLFPSNAASNSILTGGAPAGNDAITQSTITLYQGDLQLYYQLPLNALLNNANDISPYYNIPLDLDSIEISWTKSFISSPFSQDTTGVVYSFGVFYHF